MIMLINLLIFKGILRLNFNRMTPLYPKRLSECAPQVGYSGTLDKRFSKHFGGKMCVARKFLSRWIKTTFTPLCISPANLSEYEEWTAQNMQKKKVSHFPLIIICQCKFNINHLFKILSCYIHAIFCPKNEFLTLKMKLQMT